MSTTAVVRLWTAAYAGADAPWWADLLDADETARAARFVPGPRERFVRRRALLRTVLGALRGEAPARVPLARGTYGHLTVPGGPWFSVSSVPNLVAVAVANQPVGLDLEAARQVPEALEIAGSWFPSTVQQALAQASSSAMRDTLFLAAWVRLEALGKAMGLGIADRLRGEPAIAPTGGAMHREGRVWHVHAPAIAGAAHAALVIEAADVRVVPEGAPPGFPPFRA